MTYQATVVITTYNQARWVRDAVNAVLAQTVPCEVVVCDDGSTDKTLEVLQAYGERVQVQSWPHLGCPSRGRNYGAAVATTPYVAYLDADDLIYPTKVQKQINALVHSGAGWALCDATVEGYIHNGRPLVAPGAAGAQVERLRQHNVIPTAVPLLRTAVARRYQFQTILAPPPGGPYEDWYYWQAVAADEVAAYVPEVLAVYRWVANGRSQRGTRPGNS